MATASSKKANCSSVNANGSCDYGNSGMKRCLDCKRFTQMDGCKVPLKHIQSINPVTGMKESEIRVAFECRTGYDNSTHFYHDSLWIRIFDFFACRLGNRCGLEARWFEAKE